jgi:hypothetical protein
MDADRLRWLIKEGKWGLPEASELVQGAPDFLRAMSEVEVLRHRVNWLEQPENARCICGCDH